MMYDTELEVREPIERRIHVILMDETYVNVTKAELDRLRREGAEIRATI